MFSAKINLIKVGKSEMKKDFKLSRGSEDRLIGFERLGGVGWGSTGLILVINISENDLWLLELESEAVTSSLIGSKFPKEWREEFECIGVEVAVLLGGMLEKLVSFETAASYLCKLGKLEFCKSSVLLGAGDFTRWGTD